MFNKNFAVLSMPLASFGALLSVLVEANGLFAVEQGIQISPDENGQFEYVDDFQTPRFLQEAFVDGLPVEAWQPGMLANMGPHSNRTVTWRFFGEHTITNINIKIDQTANGPNFGGQNVLQMSSNGLDWTTIATSGDLEPDQHGWQNGVLTVPEEKARLFLGQGEVWVRVTLDNFSGLPTNVSNTIRQILVKLTVGEGIYAATDTQAPVRAKWGECRAKAGWRSIALDWTDPIGRHPPHYYEDIDGWLQSPGDSALLTPDESLGFPVRRDIHATQRQPLSLATFVKLEEPAEQLAARIIVRAHRDASRQMRVLWDGEQIAQFDAASYFETDRAFFVELPAQHSSGTHELRIAGADRGVILVRQLALAGPTSLQWVEKPKLPAGGSLEILSAYYMPDALPPADSQVVEGRQPVNIGVLQKGLQRIYEEHADFGGLRVVVYNNSEVPVRIDEPILLNGKPIQESYVDFTESAWDARGVVWYRVHPRLLQPGECGQIYVRFRKRPEGMRATMTIPLKNAQPVEMQIPYIPPDMLVDYVTTDKSMDRLYVYARRCKETDVGKVVSLTLDGELLKDVKFYGCDFSNNVALAVAQLPQPLKRGTYHIVGVQTDRGLNVATQFRVLPFVFPRSSIHVPPSICQEMHMNLQMWHQIPLEECEKYGVHTLSNTSGVFDAHERVAFVMGPDEPDAHDNRGGGYRVGLGYHARLLANTGWQELIERFAPQAASWIIMNGTTRPLNWWIYGQLADISCFDPYPINFYSRDHAYVRESLLLAQLSGAPNRMFACLEAFGWSGGQGVPKGARGPIPAEYRQNIVQAIGAGMKGLTSWVYVRGAGGWELNQPCREEIAKLNALIEHIEIDLLLATPIDLATSDTHTVPTGVVGQEEWPKERVWVGTLLSGPDTLILATANHIPASSEPPTIEPAENVTITVNLPSFLPNVTAFEATEDGLLPFPALTVKDGKAMLKVDVIESGRVFVLRRRYVERKSDL